MGLLTFMHLLSLPDSMSAAPSETPMMRQFQDAKRQHPDKILFFRMGDFFEMFGEDAVIGARVLQIALTSRDKKKEGALPMCGVPVRAYEQYLNKLTAAGYKVAICDQTEDPAQATGKIVNREVVRIVTPGTTVSPQLIDPDRNNYLLAASLDLKAQRLGVAYADVSTGEFELCEFAVDQLPRLYDFLMQLDPQEILLPQSRSTAESEFLETLTHRLGQLLDQVAPPLAEDAPRTEATPGRCQFIDPYHFDEEAARRNLCRHFKTLNLAGFGVEDQVHGLRAAGAVLRYLEDTQMCNLTHLTTLRLHSVEQAMLLDETTLRNLELFEAQSGQKRHTLFHVLDQTVTPMGARLLRHWLRRPLLKVEAIEERHDAVEEFSRQFLLREELRNLLKTVQDLPRLIGRLSLPVAGIPDLVGLRESLEPLQQLPVFYQRLEAARLRAIGAEFDPLTDLLERLQHQLLEAPSHRLSEGGYIAEGVSAELDELREISRNSKEFLNRVLQRERDTTGISSLKISYNKVFGYYLEVSNAHKDAVPEHYIRKQTLVNAERYITPELKEFEEKILTAEERIGKLEQELFQALKAQIVAETTRVQQAAQLVAETDVLAGLAHTAEQNRYVRPQLKPLGAPGSIRFRDSRHPVIESIRMGEPFVPNDIHLEASGCRVMLLTGPNMAGKSTFMRQIALNVLMAQAGSFVAAEEAHLVLVDRIFTRVGASDNLSQGQSTFLVEMNEAAAILHQATSQSLVVLDEIGRGTSTFDGISLAWSIAEYLHELGALTLCATHYHELNALAGELDGVENFSVVVEEHGEEIVFVRKIVAGEANKSYGVQVARLAGIPTPVVERALQVMQELEATSVGHRLPELTPSPRPLAQVEEQAAHWTRSQPDAAPAQLSLFAESPEWLETLKSLDPDQMTPLQALTTLHDLVRQARTQSL